MKRYKPTFLHDYNAIEMKEVPDGQWYHRADLIAAGVLVPVLKGDNPGCMHLVPLEDLP